MTTKRPTARKIGEIARLTGMTVRTLHYYEEIGLMTPESRTESGHRLYGPDAVERLYKISLLRQLGLPLTAIGASLDAEKADDDGLARADLRSLMTEHLAAVDAQLTAENRLRSRLLKLVGTLDSTEDTTGDLLSVLEDMTMLETTLDRRIAILVYDDIEAAYDYLTNVYGFGPGELTRDPDGNVVHGEIQAGDGEFWLHTESEEFGLKSPNNLGGASGTMAVMVDDVDGHHRFAAERGAEVRYQPVDQPYGYREYSAVDIGGHLWSFMKPLDE
ncbi:MAG: MerR family transcriptional regulator [Acidimicrobiales bacterium]